MNTQALATAANEARGLAMDGVAACHSGHLGLPLGSAEIGAVLFGHALNLNPAEPKWLNRDRFVLSAGHGSMFIYSWLHLAGFNITTDDLAKFRKLHSKTPGHPESHETEGDEATTGPLGQGVGNLVGMAASAKMAEARFNTAAHTILDHVIVGLCGDGCLQEGVSYEAAAFAGRHGLDNLILFYDSNDVTLDAMAAKTQNECPAKRFEAANWQVWTIDGHNLETIVETYAKAKADKNGRPKLILCKTLIGKGISEVEGTPKAHGEGGVKFVDAAKKSLGLPDAKFFVSEGTRAYFDCVKKCRAEAYAGWRKTFDAWKAANPELAALLASGVAGCFGTAEELTALTPAFGKNTLATRASGEVVLNAIAKAKTLVLSGSADLHGSTKNYIKDAGDFDIATPAGRNFHFGIREHAMGAILNGVALHGFFKGSGATFLTFSDYMRPAIRLAALSHLPVTYIFTHDSIGVGEDGPTHQPVETVSALRCIPNLDVIRPGDAEECAAAYGLAISRKDGPTVLALSRQNLPGLEEVSVETRRNGTLKGGYVIVKETAPLERILLATGSELSLAVEAAKELGAGTRVVSLPCFEIFERQDAAYRESVLPKSCSKRVAIEAGVTGLWWKYVGCAGKVLGTDTFGISAPAPEIFKEFGLTVAGLVAAAK